ncbi:MAG: hypothetical protein II137_01220, partial [Anaerovibrio sp.]|nr:hypothetical protein [Anaerovibrio sp.]
MVEKRRRLQSLLLIIILLVSSCFWLDRGSVTVFAATINVAGSGNADTDTNALKDAISNASSGDTISLSGTLFINDVINISGKKLTFSAPLGGTLSGDMDGDGAHSIGDTPRLFKIEGSGTEVIFSGVTVEYFDCSKSSDANNYEYSPIEISDGAKVTVESGTFQYNIGGEGGVMHVYDSAELEIKGGTFQYNKAENGGAILSGKWTDFNVTDPSQTLPGKLTITGGTFSNNMAGISNEIADGIDEEGFRPITDVGNHVSFGGGAIWTNGGLVIAGGEFMNNKAIRSFGGAIFINHGEDNKIFKGTFHDNIAYKLGGAIYSEENSNTYFGKTAVYGNNAGHFGGGLWLCPSGIGDFNTLGFAAIFGNDADLSHDGNLNSSQDGYVHPDWFPASDATEPEQEHIGGAAGDDFAIMYPNKPTGSAKSSIRLASQWFSYTKAYWKDDGRPTNAASGYYYKGTNSQTGGNFLSGFEVETGTISPAFETDGEDQLFKPGGSGTDYALALKAYGSSSWDDFSSADKNQAINGANLKIYNNTAYWSGGGVGSDGTVTFQQFGILSWRKRKGVANYDALTGSSWELTFPDGKTYIINDNSSDDDNTYKPDSDSTDGIFQVKGLPAGNYKLKEKTAPTGYLLNPHEYTATITDEQAFGMPEVTVYIGDTSDGSIYDYEAPSVQVELYKKLSDPTLAVDSFDFTITGVSALDSSGNPVKDTAGNEIAI